MFATPRYKKCKKAAGRRKERGQAVVEFALMMVFFMVILLAVLDLGRAYLTSVALENAAAEGALFAMANTICLSEPSPCLDPDTVPYRVKHESKGRLLDPDEVQVTWFGQGTPPYEPGSMVTVTVSYPYHPIIPLISTFGADPITLTSSAEQLIP